MKQEIDFTNPPVVEVVCGVAFTTLKALSVPHFGVFWSTIRDEFPRVQEAPPLPPPLGDGVGIALSQVPPLPRVWFLNDDESALIQIQKDRFIYNWKRQKKTDPYPRYETIYPQFVNYISRFGDFIKENELGNLQFRQFELSYVNHISSKSIEGTLNRFSDVLLDHRRDDARARFLPEVSNFSWNSEYYLPNDFGKFYVTAQTARFSTDNQPLIRLDISARGIGHDASQSGMQPWFDLAHEWIVRGFVDLTDATTQEKVWRRV